LTVSNSLLHDVVTDDLDVLLGALPQHVRVSLDQQPAVGELLEVVLDLGRPPEARYINSEVSLGTTPIEQEDIDHVLHRIGSIGDDNRAGIEATLHRISVIRNRAGKPVGLTCRIGRAVYGTIAIIRDIIEAGSSVLLLGKPGVGKTTMLREVARVLSDDLRKRVVIVDTSNEIAGDGDVPHPGIGRARRMQVRTPSLQHAVMIEAVENHMPQVIIIDEIGTELEAAAARTIAERGVQLIGTAHGNTLDNLMMNPTLSDLVGGIQAVTLGDEEARRRGTQKTVLERKAPPTFQVVVEIIDWQHVTVHPDVAATIDAILLGQQFHAEVRERSQDGQVHIVTKPGKAPLSQHEQQRGAVGDGVSRGRFNTEPEPAHRSAPQTRESRDFPGPPTGTRTMKIYPFGVATSRLESAVRATKVPAVIVHDVPDAEAVLTLKSYFRKKPQALRDAEAAGIPVHVLKSNTTQQMEAALSSIFHLSVDPTTFALQETEDAITIVLNGAQPVDLAPQNSYVRRMQHAMAERYNLTSRSKGNEPNRRVRISPSGRGGGHQDWSRE